MDERNEQDIECFKPREDAPKSLEPTEQPFDLMALRIQGSSVLPGRESIVLGWHPRHLPELHGQFPRRVAFIRPIHQQVDGARHAPEALP